MGEEKLAALVQKNPTSAIRIGAARPADFAQVIPRSGQGGCDRAREGDQLPDRRKVDASRARARSTSGASKSRRASPRAGGKFAWIKYLCHAKQFKRADKTLRGIRTLLGRVIRDIQRQYRQPITRCSLRLAAVAARQVRDQRPKNSA
jgi:transposase, IS5 family